MAWCFLQLQRSQTRRLSVDMEIGHAECSFARSFIRAVGAHSHRWSTVSLSLWETWHRRFGDLMPGDVDLSAVTSLTYRCHAADDYRAKVYLNSSNHKQPVLANATQLSSLTLSQWCGRRGETFKAPGLPYDQLRELRLDALGGHTSLLLALLGKCTSLNQLQWTPDACLNADDAGDEESETFAKDGIILAHVTHLDITFFRTQRHPTACTGVHPNSEPPYVDDQRLHGRPSHTASHQLDLPFPLGQLASPGPRALRESDLQSTQYETHSHKKRLCP
ncbi:hypothetical protein BDV98DRAFT_222911 [Pterulicium gracile]|uniref:Uncharacterized protein n=1 Tax=Pterulicium gracile TaxID=1884261 RepID=A0A5C3QU31_9AGAR|nr:hypothetical protein BDV98DRAFT_222911 [Pterula gracilis]